VIINDEEEDVCEYVSWVLKKMMNKYKANNMFVLFLKQMKSFLKQ